MIRHQGRYCVLALGACLVTLIGIASAEVWVRGCGRFTEEGGCLHLVVPGSGSYQMYDMGPAGDSVFVYGTVDSSHAVTCPEADAWLDAFTGRCGIVDYGCGVLVDCGEDPGMGCVCLSRGPGHGSNRLHLPPGFDLGDTVRVTGIRLCCVYGWCVEDSFISVDQIARCDSLTPASRQSWGTIKNLYRLEN
jgi:hypothetical protein